MPTSLLPFFWTGDIPNPSRNTRETVRDVFAHLFAMSPVQTPLWKNVAERSEIG
jgi:hypothetical protein